MRYRDHRGGLGESLATQREVSTWDELVATVRDALRGWFVFEDSALHVEAYGGDDDRIGWKDVQIVTVDGWGPVGFVEWGDALSRPGASEKEKRTAERRRAVALARERIYRTG